MSEVGLAPSFNLSFQNEMIIYEQNVICHVKDNEFNASYNPTLLQSNLFSGNNFYSQSLSSPLPELKDFATASFFEPYVTTIGLYNEQNDLLAVAKFAQPIPLSQNTDMTFVIRYDK
jgi:hypothetical protein